MSKRTRRWRLPDTGFGLPYWETAEGYQVALPGSPPTPEQLEVLSRDYQERIRRSPLWPQIVAQHGPEQAVVLLQQCRVQVQAP